MARRHARPKVAPRSSSPAPLRPPRDEHEETRLLRLKQELQDIALQELRWAHERTQTAMEKGQHEDADCHSMTVSLWLGRLQGE